VQRYLAKRERENLIRFHSIGLITHCPTKGLCMALLSQENTSKEMEKVEFPFTSTDRNLNLPSPLRTRDLKPLMS
jgi:hypothetical protein